MAIDIIVCDDSRFARNQLIRAIPKKIVKNIYTAANGLEAMELLRSGKAKFMFLDLTMPVMDGYEVLEAVKQEGLRVMIVVVSGDIQQQALEIIKNYNVLAFLKKPLDSDELHNLLTKYGLCTVNDLNDLTDENEITFLDHSESQPFDELAEKINIATGLAASKIADMLNLFVTMPLPNIKIETGSVIFEEIKKWLDSDGNLIVSQGFSGGGILGETLIYFSASDIRTYTKTVTDKKDLAPSVRNSLVIELASIISGTLMRNFTAQINYIINFNFPGLVSNVDNNLSRSLANSNILNVELTYTIKDLNMNIRFQILFDHATTEKLKEIMALV
jgi:CheY-like chemotaxis protein